MLACVFLAGCASEDGGDDVAADSDNEAGDGDNGDEMLCPGGDAGVEVSVAVDYPGAPDPEDFRLVDIACTAGASTNELQCETETGVIEPITLQIAGVSQPLPWTEGEALLLSAIYEGEVDTIVLDNTTVVVKTAAGALLLVASGDGDLPLADHVAPLTIEQDNDTCATDDFEEQHDAVMTYRLNDAALTLSGNDEGLLTTQDGTLAVLQNESTVPAASNHEFIDLTFVVIRTP